MSDRPWWMDASCKDQYPMFDDDSEDYLGRNAQARALEVAKATCRDCPVRVECLEDAFKYGDTDTIRGGLTAKERAALAGRKKLKVARSGRVVVSANSVEFRMPV